MSVKMTEIETEPRNKTSRRPANCNCVRFAGFLTYASFFRLYPVRFCLDLLVFYSSIHLHLLLSFSPSLVRITVLIMPGTKNTQGTRLPADGQHHRSMDSCSIMYDIAIYHRNNLEKNVQDQYSTKNKQWDLLQPHELFNRMAAGSYPFFSRDVWIGLFPALPWPRKCGCIHLWLDLSPSEESLP